jgi:hypothetical protein
MNEQPVHPSPVGPLPPPPGGDGGLLVARPLGAAAGDAAPGTATALIVFHGMGQQVRFETIDTVTRVLQAAARERGAAPDRVTVRLVQLGEHVLGRAELRLQTAGGEARDVHVYEAYWAPLTEGRVRFRDVAAFFLRAGWQGMRNSLFQGGFARFIFQRWTRFPVEPSAWFRYLLALLTLLGLAAFNAAILAVLLGRAVTSSGSPWPGPPLLGAWTFDLAQFALSASLLAAVLGGLWVRRVSKRDLARERVPLSRPAHWLAWVPTALAVASAIAGGLLVVVQFACDVAGGTTGSVAAGRALAARAACLLCRGVSPSWRDLPWPIMLVAWVAALALTWIARTLLVRFAGDVAAYVSSTEVSRFAPLRARIQETCCGVARTVYSCRQYERVLVVGHSLGSVIAYDTLNALVNEDLLAPPGLGVADRTALFLTVGSPLDKTAFVFRTQRPETGEVREALAAAAQPLIVNYRYRPARWVNIWSRQDWVSGKLEYYDDPAEPDLRRIQNVEERRAAIPLLAHAQYWTAPSFSATLLDAITGQHEAPTSARPS